jgi:hypothetical protein
MRPVPQGEFDLRAEADRVELAFPGTFLGPTRFVFDRTRNVFERNGKAVWALDHVTSVEVQATWMGPSSYQFMLVVGSIDGRTEHLYVDPRKSEVTRVAEAIAGLIGLEVTSREQPFQRQLRQLLGVGGPRGSMGAGNVPDAPAAGLTITKLITWLPFMVVALAVLFIGSMSFIGTLATGGSVGSGLGSVLVPAIFVVVGLLNIKKLLAAWRAASSVVSAEVRGRRSEAIGPGTLPGGPVASDPAALEVDAALAAEFKRPVRRAEWTGPPPDGLLDNLASLFPAAAQRQAIWHRGQQLLAVRRAGAGPAEPPEAAASPETPAPTRPAPTEPSPATPPPVVAPPVMTSPVTPSDVAPSGGAEAAPARGDPDASAAPDRSPSQVSPGPRRPDAAPPTPTSAGGSSASAAPEHMAGPRLVVVEGPLQGRQFALREPTTVIGRSIAGDVVLENDFRVAYRHARVHHRDDGWTVEDVPGSGGTSLNGERLGQPRELAGGDVIGVGATRLRFERD